MPTRRVALMTVLLALLGGCGGSSHAVSTSTTAKAHGRNYYARRQLAIGRLPNGQGFGIWAQRYRFAGKDYIQLITSTVPAAYSLGKLRQEIASNAPATRRSDGFGLHPAAPDRSRQEAEEGLTGQSTRLRDAASLPVPTVGSVGRRV